MHNQPKSVKVIMAVAVTICILFSWIPNRAYAFDSSPYTVMNGSENGMVRVRLSSLGQFSQLDIRLSGGFTCRSSTNENVPVSDSLSVLFYQEIGKLAIQSSGTLLDAGSHVVLRRSSADTGGFYLAQGQRSGNLYPGDLSLRVLNENGIFRVYAIAYLYIEDYLYGVLPYEMGELSPFEALKAQAVTARTYTLRAMSSSSGRLFDVVDTTADQVYYGTPGAQGNCKAAVDATRGIALRHGSDFCATYYTASNGGQTETPRNAWGSSSYSYLTVKDDPYDAANPYSTVKTYAVFSDAAFLISPLKELIYQKVFLQFPSASSVNVDRIVNLSTREPRYPSPSVLYTLLDFHLVLTVDGRLYSTVVTFRIFDELERALNLSINTSQNELWSVRQTQNGFVIEARRYGHGIGMSQRGSMRMAECGMTYDQIVAFYYPGCVRALFTLNRQLLSASIQPEAGGPLPSPTIEGTNVASATVNTRSGSLNLRSAPSTSGQVLFRIPQNMVVQLLEKYELWSKIKYQNNVGYVMNSFLRFDAQQTPALPSAGTEGKAKVSTLRGSLNLRAAPSSSARVLTAIPRGTVVNAQAFNQGWMSVEYLQYKGYAMSSFLKVLSSGNDPTIPPPSVSDLPGTPLPPATTPSAQPQLDETLFELDVPVKARVTLETGVLKLYKACDVNSAVAGEMRLYDVVFVTERGKTWCKITYEGKVGYCLSQYLMFDENY